MSKDVLTKDAPSTVRGSSHSNEIKSSNGSLSDLTGRRGFLGSLAPGTVATAIAATMPTDTVTASNGRDVGGVSSRLGRVRHGTTRALNIAILHASRPVLLSLFPDYATTWSALLEPAFRSARRRSDRTAARIGRLAGEAVVADRVRDGMNQLGDADGRTHRPLPYADTTGYVPFNPPDELRDPSRWQPLLVADRLGVHHSQRFVTLATADHPEYPSGSTALCHAHADVSRQYFGDDELDWTVPAPAGSSIIEPGVIPSADLVLHFGTWSDLATVCGKSRVWGGVHSEPSVIAGAELGRAVGARAAAFVHDHLSGTAVDPHVF